MKKKNRVKKSYEFQKLIHTGKKIVNSSFALYFTEKAEDESRIGITLSRKIGNAVERNLIKRQVRMMCQDLIPVKTYAYDIIIIVRFGYKSLSFLENKNNLEKLVNPNR